MRIFTLGVANLPQELGTLVIVGLVVLILAIFFSVIPIRLWIAAIASNAKVGIITLIGMKLRRVKPSNIVLPLIRATKAGLDVSINQLESHYLSGGKVGRVVDALIAAHRAKLELSFERAAAIDLAGRDVLEAVRMSVSQKSLKHRQLSQWQKMV